MGIYPRNRAEYATARVVCERALAIRRKFLGKDHPHTKFVRRHLESLPRE